MIIRDVTTMYYRIPLRTILSDSTHGDMTHFEVIMVKLTSDSGVEGIGYTYTIGHGGGAVRSLIERDLKPFLLGSDASRIEQLWEQMWWRLHYVGRGGIAVFAISAVDIALWDMKGRKEEEPFWRLLGGFSRSVKAYAGGIDLQFPIEKLLNQTKSNLAEGFRAIKMKVGREKLSEDISRVKAVRELIGPDIALMVDANMRWSVETAIRAARSLQEYNIFWLEEPIIPDDVKGHARIAREGGLPIATGENLHTIYEFRSMIEQGSISFPEPDVSNIGGVTGWMRVAKLAYANNLSITTHGVHELHLHLLAAIPNASYLEVHGFGLERFIKNPPKLEHGKMTAPNLPGHGVIFNWEALEEYK